jgi:hypothetical protein
MPDGRAVQAEGRVFTNPPAWRLGERATLRYDPEAPERAAPATFFATWLLPLVLAGMGSAFVAVGVGVVWLVRRRPGSVPCDP